MIESVFECLAMEALEGLGRMEALEVVEVPMMERIGLCDLVLLCGAF